MIGFTPASRAARVNRGAPYTPSRSQSATAGIPRRAAAAAYASGSSAPSRNENADWACSSMNMAQPAESVVHTIEGPAVGREIAGEPAERAIAERHVPFVPRPRLHVPPRPRRAPGPGAPDDALAVHPRRALVVRRDGHTSRRPHATSDESVRVGTGRGRSRGPAPARATGRAR